MVRRSATSMISRNEEEVAYGALSVRESFANGRRGYLSARSMGPCSCELTRSAVGQIRGYVIVK